MLLSIDTQNVFNDLFCLIIVFLSISPTDNDFLLWYFIFKADSVFILFSE